MSEFSTSPSGGPELPPATTFDPVAGEVPAGLEWSAAGRGEPAVLLVDAADDRAWAADAAVALAGAWARAGRRVVLADLHLDEPVVHERLGEPNLDGVVDVFLYGASLSRTARPVPGRGFYLISSGTYAEDPGAVLRHPRWPRIAAGFRDAQATLLLFVPAGASGLDALVSWAPAAIVLGAAGPAALPAGLRVRAVAVPAVAVPAAAEPEAAAPALLPDWEPLDFEAAPETTSAVEPEAPRAAVEAEPARDPEVIPWTDPYEERADPLIGEYAAGIPASTLPAGAVKTREADLRDPPVVAAADRGRTEARVEAPAGRRWLRPLLLVLVGAALVYGALYAVDRTNPDVFARILGGVSAGGAGTADPAGPADAEAPAAAPAAASAPAGVPLPYSVRTKAFASLQAARQMLEADSARLPGVTLYVSPEPVDRVLYYKVMAGALTDTVQASQVRERLVQLGVVEESDAQGRWSLVQFTPLAFDLGEFPDRPSAQAAADSLLRRQVPAYPVALPYTDGTQRWRLYGGAFGDSVGAEGLRRILADRQLPTRLVERVGSPAAPQE